MELAQRHLVEVHLDDVLLPVDAGVDGERRAEDDEQVGLVHEPARDRRPAAPEHAGCERMIIGALCLALEGREDGGVQGLRQGDDLVHAIARAVADDDDRPTRSANALDGAGPGPRRGR